MKQLNIIFLTLCMLASTSFVTAQSMFGTTGLLTIPSAEMQEDKTVMLGVGFLNETLTPRDFKDRKSVV